MIGGKKIDYAPWNREIYVINNIFEGAEPNSDSKQQVEMEPHQKQLPVY